MSNYDLAPLPDVILTDGQSIRAFINPTRMAILEMLATEKQSVSMIARQLQTHPANITHHIKLLERTGLIQLVEKRETGKNLEKLYRAVAYHFTVAPAEGNPLSKSALVLGILRDNLISAIRYLQTLPPEGESAPNVYGAVLALKLSQTDIQELTTKVTNLVDFYSQRSPVDGDLYTLNISLYPGESISTTGQEIYINE